MKDATIKPAINQIELHPQLAQVEVREYCRNHNIAGEAWSPLKGDIFGSSSASGWQQSIASLLRTIIRWDYQNGIITIPKSVIDLDKGKC